MKNHYSERLTDENTELVRGAKIGTHASTVILVHEDDLPLEEGKTIRYLDRKETTEHGFYPEYGTVEEIRDRGGISTFFIGVDGQPWDVEALQDQFEDCSQGG